MDKIILCILLWIYSINPAAQWWSKCAALDIKLCTPIHRVDRIGFSAHGASEMWQYLTASNIVHSRLPLIARLMGQHGAHLGPNLPFWVVPYTMLFRLLPKGFRLDGSHLTHWARDKMAAISQTFSNAFSCIKMYEFRLKFHWSLFSKVQLTIFHHWFR